MLRRVAGLIVAGALIVAGGASARAQGLDVDIAADVSDHGWWDETGSLEPDRMDDLVDRYDGRIAFGLTDRSFDVDADPDVAAAPILAQAVLDAVGRAGSPVETMILVDGSGAGGASVAYPYSAVVLALDAIDREDVESSFGVVAAKLTQGVISEAQPFDGGEALESGSTFTFGRILILVVIILAMALLWMTYTARRKSTRAASMSGARTDTGAELTAMSDLIFELEPRIVIANDAGLKGRFAAATKTYSAVIERAGEATEGHEVADLRIDIAKARWELDAIEAELDGVEPPPEPYTRDVSGSAWDSTRGTGAGPH